MWQGGGQLSQQVGSSNQTVCGQVLGRQTPHLQNLSEELSNLLSRPAHGQHRHDGMKAEPYKAGLHSPQGQASDSIEPVSLSRGFSPPSHQISSCCSTVSLPSNFLCKTNSLPSVLLLHDDSNSSVFIFISKFVIFRGLL